MVSYLRELGPVQNTKMNLSEGHSVSGIYQTLPPNLDVKSNMQQKKAAQRRVFSTIKMIRMENTSSYQYFIATRPSARQVHI